MPQRHVIAWIDHLEAHIIHFDRDSAHSEVIKTHATQRHLLLKYARKYFVRADQFV